MFGKRKIQKKTYDRERLEPVLKCSICTGEQVAGFKERESKKFTEVMLIRGENDLKRFMEEYGIEGSIEKEY